MAELRVVHVGSLDAEAISEVQGQPGVILVGSPEAVARAAQWLYREVEVVPVPPAPLDPEQLSLRAEGSRGL